jgi:3-methylcrotonyl-CoA carboxylase alpha subunit
MGEAAVAAARAVGYVGAGTVEFIANQDGSFYFMEMNTRLQVEHPVTEMITGTDLVEWQLRVAAGQPLPKRQDELRIHGHALEARIYAENPEKGFLPSIGTLRHLKTPPALQFHAPAQQEEGVVRIDSGVREGDAISPYYDPMIAKLITWGPDREAALALMAQALAQYQVVGLASNVAFLKRLVESRPFAAADLDTGLIARNHDALFPPPTPAPLPALALAAAALLASEAASEAQRRSDPWSSTQGFRVNGVLNRMLEFVDGDSRHQVFISYEAGGWRIAQGERSESLALVAREGCELAIRLGHAALHGTVVRDGEVFHVWRQGEHHALHWRDPMAHAGEAEAEGGRLTAPMPGKIIALLVEPGAQVERGAPLLVMEAMKMEHTISAPADGTVETLLYAVGDQVAEGAQLLSFAVPESSGA